MFEIIIIAFFVVMAIAFYVVKFVKFDGPDDPMNRYALLADKFKFDIYPPNNEKLFHEIKSTALYAKAAFNLPVMNSIHGVYKKHEFQVFESGKKMVQGFSGVGSDTLNELSQHTVIITNAKSLALPNFVLEPVRHSVFSHNRVNLKSFPAFTRKYHLQGNDETLLNNLFNEKVLNYFVTKETTAIISETGYILVYRAGEVLSEDKLICFFDEIIEILGVLSENMPRE